MWAASQPESWSTEAKSSAICGESAARRLETLTGDPVWLKYARHEAELAHGLGTQFGDGVGTLRVTAEQPDRRHQVQKLRLH